MTKTPFIAGVIVIFLSASLSTAEIKTLKITSDTRHMILLEKFRFRHTGNVSISISSVSVVASQPDPSRLGFFLLSQEALIQVIIEIQQNQNFCVLDSHHVMRLLTFRNLSPPPSASANHTYAVKFPGEYNLFFANCIPQTAVSMSLRTELYNLDNSSTRNYLSSGQTFLPTLYLFFSITYFSFLFLWLCICIRYFNKFFLRRIHLLMAALLLVKALKLLCASEEKHYVKLIGTAHGWDVLLYIFSFVYVVLFFTVIILVGTRWTFLQPFVRERGKKMLFFIIPLRVLAYAFDVVVHHTGPYTKDWITLNQVILLLDFISCFAVVLVFVWNVRSLKKINAGKPGFNSDKVRLIKRFYCVVGVYFFVVLFVLFALRAVFFFGEKQWVNNLVEETINLVFYIVMFCVFWLAEKDGFSVITEEEEDLPQILVTK